MKMASIFIAMLIIEPMFDTTTYIPILSIQTAKTAFILTTIAMNTIFISNIIIYIPILSIQTAKTVFIYTLILMSTTRIPGAPPISNTTIYIPIPSIQTIKMAFISMATLGTANYTYNTIRYI